jgi:AraC family transcriptional regulator, regulatory protein of adaptative response / methylated-DNA-[protein]-cysteine methyltransferase
MKNENLSFQSAAPFLSADARWRAVQRRDVAADAHFVYAVRSTGVYCRPSCPSRRPKRENALFFESPDAAERHGFRACQRCDPREPFQQRSLILRLCRFIEQNSAEPLNLAALAREANLSPFHLQRVFKRAVGVSPREYADACRFNGFKGRLKASNSITDALFDAGYGSTSRAYERTASRLGMTPRRYRAGGRDARIEYAVTDSPLGRLLVAATEKGVCAISLGGNDAQLIGLLRKEFPAARIEPASDSLRLPLRTLDDYLRGKVSELDLPLDIKATAFQWRVWRALQSIPFGETRTYSQIAREIKRPSAVRAVARACATNPVALIVPCHRVIRGDGQLAGYRWGLKRKQALLALEQKAAE